MAKGELIILCECGRKVRVWVEDGKLVYEIKGSGDPIIDALEGHGDNEP